MSRFGVIIDLNQFKFEIGNLILPIRFHPNFKPLNFVLKAKSETKVKVPTDVYNGNGLLPFVEFTADVIMPQTVVTCVKGYAHTTIKNNTNAIMNLIIKAPFSVNDIEENMQSINLNYLHDNNSNSIDKILIENLNKLRLDHMSDIERDKIYSLCHEYKDIFYCDGIPLSFTNQVKHEIRTKDDDPIYIKAYRQSPLQAAEIKSQVEKLLKDDVIQPSYSPWSAPVHLVPKKLDATGEQKYRMVIDYRKLNEKTIDDKYPIPNINDLFDKLGNSCYFSTIDLASGYHQIEVKKEDRPKTAFTTQFGHYEFKRMPFGLKTAPATFQRAMDNVLRGLQGEHCLVYLDDIIVFSLSLEEHINKLKIVFETLRKSNFKVQLDKSEFFKKEVLYLGHTITKDGLKPNEDKVLAVLNYPIPKTIKEIKAFLGLIGYYRRFIKDFSKITKPLTNCLKKNKSIKIDEEYIKSFETCKELLVNAPLLQFPNFSIPFILTTDASNTALGAVLSQGTIGQDKPVAYASRTLNNAESKYSAIEKELLAIIWATKHFRPYLYGRKFFIYTDHRPLVWLYSIQEPNSKLTRWRLRLQEYDFEIIYRSGKQNTNADALSRIKLNVLDTNDAESIAATRDEDESHSLFDPEETKTASEVFSDSDDYSQNFSLDSIPILNEAIDTKPNQILVFHWHKNDIKITDKSRNKQKIIEVKLPLDNEEVIKEFVKDNIEQGKKFYIYFDNKDFRKIFVKLVNELFKSNPVQIYECTERVIYIDDEEEQRNIILNYHEGKTCHRGIRETVLRIKRNYYWPNLEQLVATVINSCDLCQRMKYDRKPIKPSLQITQTQSKPFQELFMDLFSIEGKTYLTIVDAFSKLGQSIEVQNKSTPETVRALIKYFSFYGTPNKISSDQGSEFNNALMKETLAFYKIHLHIGTPNNPNSMGIVERFHSTIIEIYRLAKYEHKISDAASVMSYAVMAYNNTIHSATGLTPFEIVFGHTDCNTVFNVEFERNYMQQLMKDHAKRTSYLYKYITDRLSTDKIKRAKGGDHIDFNKGDKIYSKLVNKRKGKDKPHRNVLPIKIGQRVTKVPVKNIKRPGMGREIIEEELIDSEPEMQEVTKEKTVEPESQNHNLQQLGQIANKPQIQCNTGQRFTWNIGRTNSHKLDANYSSVLGIAGRGIRSNNGILKCETKIINFLRPLRIFSASVSTRSIDIKAHTKHLEIILPSPLTEPSLTCKK
ncbi:hypothetical protein ABMA28_005522 [Loxostege sticticalis]|uniref:RNA-directed DNA polymerase n=1 Tax=Loxostege sticticalis TaxID=481309 RepID=A0ABD0SP47_LOXSC